MRARERAEARRAGCWSSSKAVVRREMRVEDNGGERRCGVKSGEEKRLQARWRVVRRRL